MLRTLCDILPTHMHGKSKMGVILMWQLSVYLTPPPVCGRLKGVIFSTIPYDHVVFILTKVNIRLWTAN